MIDVVIVNWNSGDALRACLNSLLAFGGEHLGQIVVVDNASQDGSERVCDNYSCAKLIRNERNLGFAQACNIGAHECQGEWLLFFNPDARLISHVFDKLMSRVSAQGVPESIHGVQMVNAQGNIARSCARFPSPWQFLWHAIGLSRLFPSLGFLMLDWDHRETRAVGHVMGSFYMMHRSVFDSLGGFDEDYFVYMEDLDLSLRASRLGIHCYYWADLQVFHEGGGCSKQVQARRLFYDLRSRWIFARKHFALLPRLLVHVALLCVEPWCRSAYALVRRSKTDLQETWSAYGMLVRWLMEPRRLL